VIRGFLRATASPTFEKPPVMPQIFFQTNGMIEYLGDLITTQSLKVSRCSGVNLEVVGEPYVSALRQDICHNISAHTRLAIRARELEMIALL